MQYKVKARRERNVGDEVRVAVELAPINPEAPGMPPGMAAHDVAAQPFLYGWLTQAEAANLVVDAVVTLDVQDAP